MTTNKMNYWIVVRGWSLLPSAITKDAMATKGVGRARLEVILAGARFLNSIEMKIKIKTKK